ncbi:hypothetical protein TNCV_925241 [Trichonephila clavipes]|nr:hypothetical protein TNCV_925241 [Trichonephila clavipes]
MESLPLTSVSVCVTIVSPLKPTIPGGDIHSLVAPPIGEIVTSLIGEYICIPNTLNPTLISSASSCSMAIVVKPFNRSSVVVERKNFLINFNLEKLLSPLATLIGRVLSCIEGDAEEGPAPKLDGKPDILDVEESLLGIGFIGGIADMEGSTCA